MTETASQPSHPDLGQFWTGANVLSMVRLVLVFPVVYLILIDGSLLWILGLVLLAIATDYFDGRVARWSHTVSEWGKVLDPLADKLAGGLVVLALVIRGALPVWLVVAILARDLLIFGGGIIITRRTGSVPASVWSGKIAVTVTSVTVLAALLRADPEILEISILATVILLAYSFLVYLFRFVRTVSAPLPVSGEAIVENGTDGVGGASEAA
jgi:CDP-diacylglycerol--glycerol-3-phosphate 3-phosphatidyltransferase